MADTNDCVVESPTALHKNAWRQKNDKKTFVLVALTALLNGTPKEGTTRESTRSERGNSANISVERDDPQMDRVVIMQN